MNDKAVNILITKKFIRNFYIIDGRKNDAWGEISWYKIGYKYLKPRDLIFVKLTEESEEYLMDGTIFIVEDKSVQIDYDKNLSYVPAMPTSMNIHTLIKILSMNENVTV